MEVARTGEQLSERSDNPLFEGDAALRPLINQGQLRINEVEFGPGARTKWHTHSFEQVLIITQGAGIVATKDGERQVVPGDVILIRPGERHWHGAGSASAMRHISVNGPGETEW